MAYSEPSAKRTKIQERHINLAVVGCSHGELDAIYSRIEQEESRNHKKIDLLLCCGDFQANRNYGDLHYFHSPPWHRKLKTFYKYYSGHKTAPVLTIFVGGNHESPSFLAELPNGGWVAPNIYYMGYASVIRFAGLRISGLSGIFKGMDFNKGHFERPPFKSGSHVSAYHVRSIESFRLKQLKYSKVPMDIVITHDWPCGITDFGDKKRLLRIKPHFTEDVEKNRLGNPASMELLHELKPHYWFAAHMHVRFEATVNHTPSGCDTPLSTKFIALDKPVFDQNSHRLNERRNFIEFMQIPIAEDAKLQLSYDPEWLAILVNTNFLTELAPGITYIPGKVSDPNERHVFFPSKEEHTNIIDIFKGDLQIPKNFQQTAPPVVFENDSTFDGNNLKANSPPSLYYRNPQSTVFCEKLGITDLNELFANAAALDNCLGIPHYFASRQEDEAEEVQETSQLANRNPEEIDINLDDDEFGDDGFVVDELGSLPKP